MDDLTRDRVTNLKDWRNSAWTARHSDEVALDESIAFAGHHHAALDQLTKVVRRQVIPKLVRAHPSRSPLREPARVATIAEADVIEFAGVVSTSGVSRARAIIERNREHGLSLQSLFVELMVPAARRLADLWESDLCHYEEIAVGMLNLQQLLHDLTPAFAREHAHEARDRHALLLSAPCEQSMLGVFMVTEFYRCMASEFFHRDGWEVWPAPMSLPRLLGIVSSQWFDVIEVSATCGARLQRLVSDLAQVKSASRNANIGVFVCGPAFDEHPELVAEIGADACAHDARETLQRADAWLERQPRRT